MKSIIALILAKVLLVFSFSAAYAWDDESMNDLIQQSNFIVENRCSGTLISLEERLILTNYHCIDDKVEIIRRDVVVDGQVKTQRHVRLLPVNVSQHTYDGHDVVGTSSYVTEIVARKKTRDLAVLKLRGDIPHTRSSELLSQNGDITRIQRVMSVGNPAGMDASAVEGIISSTTRTFRFPWTDNEELPMIQFSGGIFGGNSGGALYNMKEQLIGVPAASLRGANFIGLAIPINIVWEVLAENCLAEPMGGKDHEEMCENGERVVPSNKLDAGEGIEDSSVDYDENEHTMERAVK